MPSSLHEGLIEVFRQRPAFAADLVAGLVLLVLSPDHKCADWCVQPIRVGHPGWELRPLVLGPREVPVITDTDQATDNPELSLLSVVAHNDDPERDKIFDSFLHALQTVDDERAGLYADLVLAALPAATRHHLETLMSTRTYEYQSDFVRRFFNAGRADGQAKGEARSLLAVLAARGFDVPASARERITSCTDLDMLEIWIRRAVTIETLGELF